MDAEAVGYKERAAVARKIDPEAGSAFVIRVVYGLSAYCRRCDGGSTEAESEHSGSKYSVSA